MQKVTRCQPLKLVSFIVLLWQDAFCQVLYEWAFPVFANEHNITFLSVCYELAGPVLGLDSICVFTHAWRIEACPLKFAVKADLPTGSTSLVMYFLQLSLGGPTPRIWTRPYLASCGITLFSLGRHSLLVPLVLRHLPLSSRLPL